MSLQSGKITVTHFVWNQDEVAQNSREAKRFCNISLYSAQTMRPFCGSRHSFAVIFIPYATFRFPVHKNEGNTYYGKYNVPPVRKNYGHSFRVEPRRSGAKLARI